MKTLVAVVLSISVWMFAQAMSWGTVDCPAGIALYLTICLVASLPATLIIRYILAPLVLSLTGDVPKGSSLLIIFVILGFVWLGFDYIWGGRLTSKGGSAMEAFAWYFSKFMIPPMLVGLGVELTERTMRIRLQRTPQSEMQ